MNKTERDPKVIKSIIKVAIEVFHDNQVANVDKLTRLRAAMCFGEQVGLDVSELKDLEGKL